jgi:hypothetical protein
MSAEDTKRKFGLPVSLVIIDPYSKAVGFTKTGEENDAATEKITFNTLETVAKKIECLVLTLAHLGKQKETGTRGTSGLEDDVDLVLASLPDRTLKGAMSDLVLAVRKRKYGTVGDDYPYSVRPVDMGHDPRGFPIDTLVIEWRAKRDAKPDAAKADKDPWRTGAARKLRQALMTVLIEHGQELRPWRDGPSVRAVRQDLVRQEFDRIYSPSSAANTPRARADAKRKAFDRAMDAAGKANVVGAYASSAEAATFIWLIEPKPRGET